MRNFIKKFLEQKSITQKEVAEAIGMTEAGLSKAIKGSATKDTIDKVAQFLNVKPDDLIDHSVLCAKYSSDKTPLHFGDVEVPCYVMFWKMVHVYSQEEEYKKLLAMKAKVVNG